ncbi:MAG: nuclear transport factor 2 family protein [Candidatus Cloacimonetes bacterium]|nr:nuclear transport factor 2 family protein [Candidatus Cloacimonadota bacterium]MBS3767001.1 nuclear transport factor 2 family protein [Candidatus Cloacimonadota bacterium]
MKMKKVISALLLVVMLLPLSLLSQDKVKNLEKKKMEISLDEKGKALVQTLWKNMKFSNINKIYESTAYFFQSLHQDGVRNRQEELHLISKLNLDDYELSNFTVTHNEDLIIVSYDVTVSETIKDKRHERQTTPRTTIFQKIDGKWLWVYHVNPVKL